MMLDTLARASIEGAILAIGVWMLLRIFPRMSPAIKATLWWCVAAKFVVTLLPIGVVSIPLLPQVAVTTTPSVIADSVGRAPSSEPVAPAANVEQVDLPFAASADWATILLGVWLVGVVISLVHTAVHWRRMRRIIARSSSATPITCALLADVARLLGLDRQVELRMSDEVESPLITGIRRPLILVPANRFPLMSVEQRRMVICHELAHLKRRDVLFSCIPAIAERLFFFHPLTRLAAREYAFWREAACDAAVLAALKTAPRTYGQLLLELGVARQSMPVVANAAMSYSTLKRRLVMLNRPFTQSLPARVVTVTAVAFAMMALAPVRLVARTAAVPVEPQMPAFIEPTASLAETTFDKAAHVESSAVDARTTPATSTAEQAPATLASPEQDRLSYVLFKDGNSSTMSGSGRDMTRARSFRNGNEPLLWFRLDGREYVVRDAQVLDDASAAWEEVGRIGQEQGRIGAQQGEIGARQGEVGARQGAIGAELGILGAKQGLLAARQGLLSARLAAGVSSRERTDIEREQEEIDRDMRQLEREMRVVSDRMRDADRPMNNLGEDMEKLGRVMSQLGKEMEQEVRRAEDRMLRIVRRAIDSGAARRVD